MQWSGLIHWLFVSQSDIAGTLPAIQPYPVGASPNHTDGDVGTMLTHQTSAYDHIKRCHRAQKWGAGLQFLLPVTPAVCYPPVLTEHILLQDLKPQADINELC